MWRVLNVPKGKENRMLKGPALRVNCSIFTTAKMRKQSKCPLGGICKENGTYIMEYDSAVNYEKEGHPAICDNM